MEGGKHSEFEGNTQEQWCDAYQRAQREGKEVVYVCAEGRDRSVQAAGFAVRRGETHSRAFLGYNECFYILEQPGYASETQKAEVEAMLRSLAGHAIVRIFETYGQYEKMTSYGKKMTSEQWFRKKLLEYQVPEVDVERITEKDAVCEMMLGQGVSQAAARRSISSF